MKTVRISDINDYINLVNHLREDKSGLISLENVLLEISNGKLDEYKVEILAVPIYNGVYVATLNPLRIQSSFKEKGLVKFEHVISMMKMRQFEDVFSIFGEVYVVTN